MCERDVLKLGSERVVVSKDAQGRKQGRVGRKGAVGRPCTCVVPGILQTIFLLTSAGVFFLLTSAKSCRTGSSSPQR